MDRDWYTKLVNDMASFAPDQEWEDIVSQLVDTLLICNGRLTSGDMGSFISIAAAIKRKGEGPKGLVGALATAKH